MASTSVYYLLGRLDSILEDADMTDAERVARIRRAVADWEQAA